MAEQTPTVPVVALASWLVPGGGYWLIGERTRAITVGVTIVALFLMGIVVGGVRVIDVPRFNEEGVFNVRLKAGRPVVIDGRVAPLALLPELRNKPWSLAQVLTGPVAIVGGAASVWASRESSSHPGEARGLKPHARIWEISVLYTAVAGLMNLIAIIDAAHRARKGTPA